MKRLLLIGGGHAHVEVLRQLGMHAAPGVDVTLVSPSAATPYSGMLPGYVAGHYGWGDFHIQLVAVAGLAYASFLQTAVTRLDLDARVAHCMDESTVAFDIVSIDVGSTPDQSAPGTREHTVPVKPVERFLVDWGRLIAGARAGQVRRIAVVGSGAGGIEILLAMQHRLRHELPPERPLPEFILVGEPPSVLPSHPWLVRRLFRRILAERAVELRLGRRVVGVTEGALECDDGSSIIADRVVWVVTASAAPWFAESGLACDDRGFIAVNDSLQSVSHPFVFGAGDCVSQVGRRVPKSGVYAVRQGPVLTENLRRALRGDPLTRYRPQRRALALISTGDQYAVASRGPFAAWGKWVWRWKDRIDRMFMMKYMGMM